MKIFEIAQELAVEIDDQKQTVLVDPKTKVKTVVPKDPNKPGMIKRDEKGQLTFSKATNKPQPVEKGLKPGEKVKVDPNAN
jgi:transcription antitermination factor NusG